MVISIPYQSVAMKVSAVQQPPWTTQEMPRNVITFAHAQARQISIHEAVDIPHFVTLPESPVTLKINRIPKSNVSSCVRHNLLCSNRHGDFFRLEDNMLFLRVKTSRFCTNSLFQAFRMWGLCKEI